VSTTKPQRPLSPFMLGTHYRFQLTSVTSFLHRVTGIVLGLGAFGFVLWLHAVAGDGVLYGYFRDALASTPGCIALYAFAAALIYHLLNGIRHMVWDAGWWLELKPAYRSGWTVLVLTVILTALLAVAGRGGVA